MGQQRYLVNETFTDDNGNEYVGGGIYEVDEATEPLIESWIRDGKVRDPDADVENTIEEAKAKHEAEDNGDDDEDDDDDLTPEEIDQQIEDEDK